MSRVRIGIAASVVLVGVWIGCGAPHLRLQDPTRPLRPRPSHFGLSLPVPVSSLPWLPDSSEVKQLERRIPVDLSVDRKGRVTGVAFEPPVDTAVVSCYEPYLSSFKFEPGLRDGASSDMVLRLELQTTGPGSRPTLHFPVGPNREIERSERYWAALAANGIETARLVSFPSYYYQPTPLSAGSLYDYKLYRVDLDSLGQVTAVEPLVATTPQFTDQIRTAIKWAEYQPLRLDGRPTASSNYLAVALFPDAEYPTERWHAQPVRNVTNKEQFRVRLFVDTVGEMFPPIVKQEWSGPIVDSGAWEQSLQTVSAAIRIDTAGASFLSEVSVDSWRIRRVLVGRCHDRRFFPARGFDGAPLLKPWLGIVYARPGDAFDVLVWFDWSHEPVVSPSPDNASKP